MRLTSLALEGKKRYAERWLDSVVDVILERESDEQDVGDPNLRFGTTANYLKAAILDVPPSLKDGEMIRVRLIVPGTGHKSDVLARYIPNEASLGEASR